MSGDLSRKTDTLGDFTAYGYSTPDGKGKGALIKYFVCAACPIDPGDPGESDRRPTDDSLPGLRPNRSNFSPPAGWVGARKPPPISGLRLRRPTLPRSLFHTIRYESREISTRVDGRAILIVRIAHHWACRTHDRTNLHAAMTLPMENRKLNPMNRLCFVVWWPARSLLPPLLSEDMKRVESFRVDRRFGQTPLLAIMVGQGIWQVGLLGHLGGRIDMPKSPRPGVDPDLHPADQPAGRWPGRFVRTGTEP